MQAVVLAAGEGRRLRPLTETKPKGLVTVADKPILTHCFEKLAATGADEIIVVVGYRAEQVIDFYGDSFADIPIRYALQKDQLGVAHAMAAASEYVSGPFMLMHGDYLFGQNLQPVIDRHGRLDPAGTLLVESVSEAEAGDYGVCEFDEAGELTGLIEKPDDPPSTVIITGFFVFDPVILHACQVIRPSNRGEYELADAVELLLHAGYDIELVHADDWLVNVNEQADIARAERQLGSG